MAHWDDLQRDSPEAVPDDPALVIAGETRLFALRNAAWVYLAVGAGSVIGGVARWTISESIAAWIAAGPHWGTLFVNVTGSFLIGLYVALTGPGGRWPAGAAQRHFAMTGVCGGYTTFSIFSLETVRLFEAGLVAAAGGNIVLSLAGWLAAVWCGYALGARLGPRAP